MSDYSDMFESLYGHPSGREPPELPVIRKVARDFVDASYKFGAPIIRQIAIEGDRAGLDGAGIQYFYWVFFDSPRTWPTLLPKAKTALFMARKIASESGSVPNYSIGLQIPDRDKELLVDQAVVKLATWCLTSLTPLLRREWDRILRARAGRAVPEIESRFKEELYARPHTFIHSSFLTYAMRLFE